MRPLTSGDLASSSGDPLGAAEGEAYRGNDHIVSGILPMSEREQRQRLILRSRASSVISVVVMLGFFGGVVTAYIAGIYSARGYPYDTFLFNPADHFSTAPSVIGVHAFGDLWAPLVQSSSGSPYLPGKLGFPSNYLPFTHLILRPLADLPYRLVLAAWEIGTVVGMAALWLWSSKGLRAIDRTWLTLTGSLLAYPVLFQLDRANVEILVFGCTAGAVVLTYSQRAKPLQAVLLSSAIALKGFPILLLLVPIVRREWRAVIAVLSSSLLESIVALLTFRGGLIENLHLLRHALSTFSTSVAAPANIQHSSDVASWLALIAHFDPGLSMLANHAVIISLALGILVVIFIILGWLRNRMEPVGTVTALCCAMVVLVPGSYDYRLLYVTIPLALLLRSGRIVGVSGWSVVLLLALLLVPKGWPVFFADVELGVLVNPLLLLGCIGIVLAPALGKSAAERHLGG